MDQDSDIRLEGDGAILRVTLSRPKRMNAIDADSLQELSRAIRGAGADDGIRAIVLMGEGRALCTGRAHGDRGLR